MAKDEAALRTVVEQSAAILTAAGVPRMPARVLMTLLVSETGGHTAAELGALLGASAAAVSGAVRYLQTIGMAHRVSEPGSRRDRYALPDDAWYTAMARGNPIYEPLAKLADSATEAIGDRDSDAAKRTAEMAAFYRFMSTRMAGLLEEWERQRGE